MKNHSKMALIMLSAFYFTAMQPAQKDSPENLVVDRLTKIDAIIKELNKLKIASILIKDANGQFEISKGGLENLSTLSKYLGDVTNSLNKSDKKTRDQIVEQLRKQPNNALFKKYISFLTNNQDNNFFISTDSSGMPLEYEIERTVFSFRSNTNIIKQDVVNYIKGILTKLGYDPSEFIKLNK